MTIPSSNQGSLQRRTNWWGAFVIGLAGTLLVTGIGLKYSPLAEAKITLPPDASRFSKYYACANC